MLHLRYFSISMFVLILFSCQTSPAKEDSPSGGLKTQEVQGVIRRNLGQIEKCYETTAFKEGISGQSTRKFTIGPLGRIVKNAVSRDLMESPALDRCIEAAMASWEFPAPRRGAEVHVNYPFRFCIDVDGFCESLEKILREKLVNTEDCANDFWKYSDLGVKIKIMSDGTVTELRLQDSVEPQQDFPCFSEKILALKLPMPADSPLPIYSFHFFFKFKHQVKRP